MYVRIARFEGGSVDGMLTQADRIRADIEALRSGKQATATPRELADVVSRIAIFADRERNAMIVTVYCDTEEQVRRAHKLLDAMTPDRDSSIRRTSAEVYEVVLDETMPSRMAA